jgi:hypothetical protein
MHKPVLKMWGAVDDGFRLPGRGSWQSGFACGNHDRSNSPDYTTRFQLVATPVSFSEVAMQVYQAIDAYASVEAEFT